MTKRIAVISLCLALCLSACGPGRIKADPSTPKPVAVERQYPPIDLIADCPGPPAPESASWFDLSIWAGRTKDALVACNARMACLQIWRAEGKGTPEQQSLCANAPLKKNP